MNNNNQQIVFYNSQISLIREIFYVNNIHIDDIMVVNGFPYIIVISNTHPLLVTVSGAVSIDIFFPTDIGSNRKIIALVKKMMATINASEEDTTRYRNAFLEIDNLAVVGLNAFMSIQEAGISDKTEVHNLLLQYVSGNTYIMPNIVWQYKDTSEELDVTNYPSDSRTIYPTVYDKCRHDIIDSTNRMQKAIENNFRETVKFISDRMGGQNND